MSAPRHLWSGDWRHESSAHGEELAARRAQGEPVSVPEPAPAPRRRRRSAADRLRAFARSIRRLLGLLSTRRLAGGRRVRVAGMVVLLVLVLAGAAYAVSTTFTGNGPNGQAVASGYQAWLGIDLYNSPYGGPIVVGVVPGSPAQAAGVQPGDVITRVDGQPVGTASAFASAIAGKHAGDHVVLQLERGAVTYYARVTLANRPVAYP
jgi:hypothetical protein